MCVEVVIATSTLCVALRTETPRIDGRLTV